MFFIVVMFALMFCLALLIKTLYERRNVSDTFSVDSTLRQEVLSQYKSSTNHISRQTSIEKKKQIHQRLLSEETATIGQVNEQLELYSMFDHKKMPPAVVDKLLTIILLDQSSCGIEKLITLEHLKQQIQPTHLASLRAIFMRFHSKNYLFDLEIYKLVKYCEDCAQKHDLLMLISQMLPSCPDLAAARKQA
ncbi:hypothetical protein tloyanaT_22440 [Thalassotalea loyana]|uniref:Uncharacterized protein n=1 Tax=Thalassotalea loyana TaxID=280483 RepID=A0ABQ6HD20_9GAMM|nr:hypothetical protein [Thalassotalea loyana]GLX85992.1 hypothetical protein tloyanaT_22440 [Thalassotalea loyana]